MYRLRSTPLNARRYGRASASRLSIGFDEPVLEGSPQHPELEVASPPSNRHLYKASLRDITLKMRSCCRTTFG